MKITVIGTGYVGLVTGVGFAELGSQVHCIDTNEEKIARLKQGECPIHEIGLGELIVKTAQAGRLHFHSNAANSQHESDLIFIAVGTPQNEAGKINLDYLWTAVKNLVENHKSNKNTVQDQVWVIKSTVAMGTCRKINDFIREQGITEAEVQVVSNPEFLRQGSAVKDFFKPDRIIIGTENKSKLKVVKEIYESFSRIDIPILTFSWETSELIKYASNVFLAAKISYINEIANICDLFGANVKDVSRAMGLDERIGNQFLNPGPGFGGSCFPKDTQALTQMVHEKGYDFMMGKSIEAINLRQKKDVVTKLQDYFKYDLKDKVIGILGLAFKPNTDDMREAPSIVIIQELLAKGAKLQVFDPQAMTVSEQYLNKDKISYKQDAYSVAQNADAVLVLTEWREFRMLDLEKIKKVMAQSLLVDTRNIYDPKKVKDLGFDYIATGQN